ncbi:right-handed parallel beta-helix repeat-containing protein [Hymenobacter yonginensis]|uniref:T9SS type A sorting domain-containing protein n=1 Tax=Hymenobacter yonginensis TaxID=748197 RepID=A0ABY7PML4_9BACT|nr:T9SS type A sorting domain-containing protein [Hymenobacter yonginensis]WBO83919.1 T9SS type A sorting domain-containing protein [Hymenobacter yonginensis]
MKTPLSFLVLLLALLLAGPSRVQAQATVPFSCDGSFYQIRLNGTTTDFYRIRRGTVFSETILYSIPNVTLNGLAFNKSDGYYYAVQRINNVSNTDQAQNTAANFYRLGQTGFTVVGTVASLPKWYYSAGTIDENGVYWLQRGTNPSGGTTTGVLQKVQITGSSLTYGGSLQVRQANANFDPVAFGDLAFNPKNGLLYDIGSSNGYYTIDRTTGVATNYGSPATQTPGEGVGSTFFDALGNYYAYANGTVGTANSGKFYLMSPITAAFSKTVINAATPTGESDGASCAFPEQRVDNVLALTGISNISTTTFDVSFKVGVDNPGSLDLTNLQLTFFGGTAAATTNPFPGASSVTLQAIAATNGLTAVATGQDMLTSRNLLSGSNTLGNAASAEVTFTVRVVYPTAGAVPTTAVQNLFTYASSTSAGPNPGASIVNGAALPPPDLLAADASTNGSLFPVTSNADTPSPTPVQFQPSISGTVFEDINYGGGAGRSRVASQGPAVSGARVELYNASTNAFVSTTTTAADGTYSFTGLANGTNYVVRVVNGTVSSTRPGTVAGLLPVQTFVNGDVNRVGGESPQLADGGNNTGALNTFQLTNTTQSVTTVALNGAAASVDFGFNFSTIVNTNNSGQGSLRQFILNSNALTNANLDQVAFNGAAAMGTTAIDPAVGMEYAIFMLNDGRLTGAPAGLRNAMTAPAGYSITSKTFTFNSATLPTITDSNTAIDGKLQTILTGEGTQAPTANTTAAEIILNFSNVGANRGGLLVLGANTRIASISVTNAGTAAGSRALNTTGAILADGAAIVFTGAGTIGSVVNDITGQNNTIATVLLEGGATGVTISSSVMRTGRSTAASGTTTAYDGAGILLSNASGNTITNNNISANNGFGIELAGGSNGNTITGNTVGSNGAGATSSDAGISITAGNNNTFGQNTITGNAGDGIVAASGTSSSLFTKNSTSGNGNLGIDLSATNAATGDDVSINANGKTAASGANGLLNFPVLTQAVITNTTNGNLQITGFAPAGSVIEFFLSDKTVDGFGQGKTYLFSTTEGASMTAAANGTNAAINDVDARFGSYSGTINGLNNGAETGATRFSYVISLSTFSPAQVTALTTGGARLTATATTGGTTTSEFSSNILISQNAPLPVELKAFEVAADNADANLIWSTASEKNNDHFDVERSFDGSRFERIGQVQGRGTTSQTTNYSFTDVNVGNKRVGVVYYRLQQVDTDGTTNYSPVRTVRFAAGLTAGVAAVGVYPNPATTQDRTTMLDLTTLPIGMYEVTVLDATGRVVRRQTVQGGQNQPLNVQQLLAGMYLVQVRGNGLNLTQRFSKQ